MYLYSGKVVCPSCGNIMVAHRGRVDKEKNTYRPNYICGNRYITGKVHTSGGCSFGGGISEFVIEKFLLANIRPLLESYLVHFEQQNTPAPGKDKIKSINAKLSRLKDLYIDGLIDKDSYRVDYERLQKELAMATYVTANQKTIPPLVDKIMDDDDFVNTYLTLSREQKRELWQSFIQRIELGRRPEERGKSYKDIRVFFY
nr:zinc ribbon domain-containing protein [Selenomonas sp.]